ncbi:MAG: hypothetical protein V4598_14555 [Bdellovibrionota bacterium]
MADNDFLSFLVDETLKLQKRGEEKLSSLETKLNDYGLNYWKGDFIPQSQVLRFITPMGAMDVPMNWSVFSCVGSDHRILDKQNDTDNFFSVIKAAWKLPLEKVVIIHADGFCYLVGLTHDQQGHLHDLLNPQEWLKTA